MTTISTHVLDTARGAPASGLQVELQRNSADQQWEPLASAVTDGDGRVKHLADTAPGTHRLVFDTSASPFFPQVIVTFEVSGEEHLHVPLLLSPYGYSVYRGT